MDGGTIIIWLAAIGELGVIAALAAKIKNDRLYLAAADERVKSSTGKVADAIAAVDDTKAKLASHASTIRTLESSIESRDARIAELQPLAALGKRRKEVLDAQNDRRKNDRAVARAERKLTKPAAAKPEPVGQLAATAKQAPKANRPVKRRAAKK